MTFDGNSSSHSRRGARSWATLMLRLDGTIGRASTFVKQVLTPHAFVFVLLLVTGAILEQGLESFIVRLSALSFIFGVGFLASTSREYVSYRLVVSHVGILASTLVVIAGSLRLEPLTHVFLPLIGLLAPLAFFRLPLAVGGTVVGVVVLLTLFYTPLALFEWGVASGVLGGLSGILLAGGLVLIRARRIEGEGPRFDSAALTGGQNLATLASPNLLSEPDDTVMRRELQMLWNRTALGEFLGEVLWRLIATSLLVGVTVCALICRLEPPQLMLALSWVAFAAIQITLFIQILQARDLARVIRTTFLCVVVIIGWWETLVAEPRIDGLLPETLLAFVVIAVGSLPWPRRVGFALCGIFVGAALLRFLSTPAPLVLGLGLACLCPLMIRLFSISHVNTNARIALHFLRRFGEGAPTSLPACRALAWQVCRIIESPRALLLVGERRLEVLEGAAARPSPVDPVFARGLYHTIVAQGAEEGTLLFRDLSTQFLAPCLDWFGFVPAEFYYLRVTAIVDGREEIVVLVVPCTITARLCGHTRVVRVIGGLAAIVRTWLSAARGRFLSSDVIMASQQTISAREEDLNHLVHLVNNVAQDISAECDELREFTRSSVGETASIRERIDGIERLVRSMSAGVSDVKLLKELLRVRVAPVSDTVDVASLVDDVAMFGHYRASRSGKPFRVDRAEGRDARLTVASREFLSMVLRMLIRLAEGRAPGGSELVLGARQEAGMIRLSVSDGGAPPDTERIEREMIRIDDSPSTDRSIDMYRAAYNLARLSGGDFSLVETSGRWEMVMRLPRGTDLERSTLVDGWILLVDDNPQVTSFYARVAEALQYRYFTAASVEEAQSIVVREGQPRLVVSDLQLGEGSGLDLLRDLRHRFDPSLPIIVVSGNTGSGVAEEVRAAGATSYLAKPVGRSKLISEIQALLQRSANNDLR